MLAGLQGQMWAWDNAYELGDPPLSSQTRVFLCPKSGIRDMAHRNPKKVYPHSASRRGVASVKVIVALPAVLVLSWLSVEIGFALRAYAQAKTAADAIALAAAARYQDGPEAARVDALTAASANKGPNGPLALVLVEGPQGGGDLLFGDWDEATRQFLPNEEGGPAVRARVRFAADHPNGPVGLVLAGLFTSGPFSIERSSIAVYRPARHTTSVLLVDQNPEALELSGTANVRAAGGVSVASTSATAVALTGTSTLVAPIVRIAGDLGTNSEAGIEGRVETGAQVPVDPQAGFALPPWGANPPQPITHDDVSETFVAPGLHAGLTASGGRVVLLPGLHQFAGPIALSGTAELVLDEATIHLGDGLGLELRGSSRLVGDPVTTLAEWGRCWMLQRGARTEWHILDSALLDVAGRCYGPRARLVVDGGAEARVDAAILLGLQAEGTASVRFKRRLPELDLEPEPGRARLVR